MVVGGWVVLEEASILGTIRMHTLRC